MLLNMRCFLPEALVLLMRQYRLRHLLLSGMVVLKQQTVALEWFEPLLLPWVHYVPISASLHNLSDAVLWVISLVCAKAPLQACGVASQTCISPS